MITFLTQNSAHPTHCNVSNSTIFKSVAALLMHFSKLMWVRGSDVHLSGSRSKQNAHSCFIFIGYKRILIFLSSLMLIKVNVNVTITTDTSGCKLPLGRVLQYIPLLGSVLCFVTFLYPDFSLS